MAGKRVTTAKPVIRYPLSRLEEDLLRWEIVRRIEAMLCGRCTKARCRRVQPCRKLIDLDREIVKAQAIVAAEKTKRLQAAASSGLVGKETGLPVPLSSATKE